MNLMKKLRIKVLYVYLGFVFCFIFYEYLVKRLFIWINKFYKGFKFCCEFIKCLKCDYVVWGRCNVI